MKGGYYCINYIQCFSSSLFRCCLNKQLKSLYHRDEWWSFKGRKNIPTLSDLAQWDNEYKNISVFFRCKPKEKKRMSFIAPFSRWDTPRKYYSVLIFLQWRWNCRFCLQPDPIKKIQPYFFPARQLNYISAVKANIIWPKTQSYW